MTVPKRLRVPAVEGHGYKAAYEEWCDLSDIGLEPTRMDRHIARRMATDIARWCGECIQTTSAESRIRRMHSAYGRRTR